MINNSICLMFHDIVTSSDRSSGFQNKNAFQYKVDETLFEKQVEALQGKKIIFTFDDGGVSFITKAAPILEKYGFKGVFFISTGYIGTPGFLTREQVKELSDRGHIVGSHSHTHPPLFTNLSKEEIKNEWKESFDVLKEITGKDSIPASIPNGYASKVVLGEAILCGLTEIYTSQPTVRSRLYKNHKIYGRYVVHSDMSVQDVLRIVSSKSYRFKQSLKWHMLNVIKSVLGSSYDNIKATIINKG